jgi:CheY-like chemotaxis protein
MEDYSKSAKTILLVEDSDEDFVATSRAFEKSGCDYLNLKRVANARQALDFLLDRFNYEDCYGNENLPALILLDLNLPGIDGRELLVQLKGDDRYKEIPVVILTTSNNPRDISYCFNHGANSYQIKHVGFEKYFASIKSMINYWFETAKIPATGN